jgi:hypothetical protein
MVQNIYFPTVMVKVKGKIVPVLNLAPYYEDKWKQMYNFMHS